MATKDWIGPKYTVNFKGDLCVNDLYKVIERWFSRFKYDADEKEHKKLAEIHGKKLLLSYIAIKNITDYHRYQLLITVTCSGMQEISKKGAKKCIHNCDAKVSIEAVFINDYEEKWTPTPVAMFMREFFNKFITSSRQSEMESELSTEARSLRDELRAFFNINKHR
jgi:hypothetical protein